MADEYGNASPNGPGRQRPGRGRHRADPESSADARAESQPDLFRDSPDVEQPTVILPALGRSAERLAAARTAESATTRPPKRRRRWRRIAAWTSAALVVVLAGVGAFGYFTYKHYDGRIHRADTLAKNDPHIVEKTKQEHAQNFLLIGSDTRAGANGKYEASSGEVAGARSDTTILAHLSPDGGKATMVSFPRDSWVHVPECRKADGSTSKPYDGMFNSAFELGGAACTIRLVQELTGIEINHSVQVDFTGFKTMVSALGGVPVCTPAPVDDTDSGLHLKKGTTNLTGDQALAYVRARHNIGDGSDLGRIKRQQQFLGSMIRVATSKGILFNPGKLKKFLDAATTSVTLDKATHLTDLYGLAQQLHHLDAAHANFLTVPIANPDYTPPGQSSGGRVQLDLAAAKPLWKAIIDDNATVTVPVDGSGTPKPTASKSAPAKSTQRHATTPKLTVAPQDVTVRVVNGVGTRNLATRASADLTTAGFTVSTLSVEPSGATRPVVQYAPAELAAARTLAAAVPGAVMQADSAAGAGQVVLVVGSAYTGAHAVAVGDPGQGGSTRMAGSDHTATSPTPSALKSVSAADKSCSL